MNSLKIIKMENPNQPAFPRDTNMCGQLGLSKRELLAAMAMQGILANPNGGMMSGGGSAYSPENVSKLSILRADELLKALEK